MVLSKQPACKRPRQKTDSVRLPWGPWRVLDLENVPSGALIFHLQDDELPTETRLAVRQELLWRLQDLLVWGETELSQQGIDPACVREAAEAVNHGLDRLHDPMRAAS